MGYSWVSTEILTGEIIADLPLLDVPYVSRSIGLYDTTTGNLPIATEFAPENWQRAILEGGSNLILLQDNPDDPAHGIPIWGGMVTSSTPDHTDVVPLSLATLEAYMDRRYVGDVTFTSTGQNDIVAALIAAYVVTGPNGGIPLRVQYATAGAGKLRDRTYADSDDKTVYSALTDLMGVIDGPEWTIEWEWQHNPERITPVLYVGDRIGNPVTPGLAANATFDMPGCVSTASLARDYSSGKGANTVVAVSTADGDVRPQSPAQILDDPERPTFEYRWTPSTSITDIDTLTDHALKALAVLGPGSQTVALAAVAADAPPLGVDWRLGDDIGYSLGGINSAGVETVPAFPGGVEGTGRAIGWELDLTATPVVIPTLASASF
ncbi:MAG TPA: hypothetical protein VGM94_05000 [Galbitalea sp.]|jgi:hypothetical protein